MRKFSLYDVVTANREIDNIPQGTLGTIVVVYEDLYHYEVEFVDAEGDTMGVLTVAEHDLQPGKASNG